MMSQPDQLGKRISRILTGRENKKYLLIAVLTSILLISPLYFLSTTNFVGQDLVETRLEVLHQGIDEENSRIVIDLELLIYTQANPRIGIQLNQPIVSLDPSVGMGQRIQSYFTIITEYINPTDWEFYNNGLSPWNNNPYAIKHFRANGELQLFRALQFLLVVEIDNLRAIFGTDTFQFQVENIVSLPLVGELVATDSGIIHFPRVYSNGISDHNPTNTLVTSDSQFHDAQVYSFLLSILGILYVVMVGTRFRGWNRSITPDEENLLYPFDNKPIVTDSTLIEMNEQIT